MKIINLTQHPATEDQLSAGVVDLDGAELEALKAALTFTRLPSKAEIRERAALVAEIAAQKGFCAVMIGGAPFLMLPLESQLRLREIKVFYAFSERVSAEEVQPDGSVKKINIFKHSGFVEL